MKARAWLGLAGLAALVHRLRDPVAPAATAEVSFPDLRSQRFGVCAVGSEPLERLGAAWYMNWTHTPHADSPLDFVPLVFGYVGGGPVSDELLDTVRGEIASMPDGTLFVAGNEVGYKAQQDWRTPETYALDFHRIAAMLHEVNPTFRVSTGPMILSTRRLVTKGITGAPNGLVYMDRVLRHYDKTFGEPFPADAFAATAHVLEGRGCDSEVFERQIRSFRKLLADQGHRNKPLVLTEVGVGIGTRNSAKIADYARRVVDIVANASDDEIGCTTDGNRLVQRMAWFTAQPMPLKLKLKYLGLGALMINLGPTALFQNDGTMTNVGAAYAQAIAQAR